MIEGIIMAELGIMSYYDVRYKGLPKKLMIIIGLINVPLAILYKQEEPIHMVTGALLGVMLLVLGKITRESIGYGDGLLFLFIGIVMGGVPVTVIFMMSMVAVFVYGMILCVCKRANRKSSMPLVPFMAFSYLLYSVGSIMRDGI